MSKFIEEHKAEITLVFIMIAILIAVLLFNLKKKEIFHDLDMSNETVEEFNVKYEENEYKVITMDQVDLINLYHNDFVYRLATNPEETWNLLSSDGKANFKDKDDYVNYIKNITTKNTKTSKVVSYKNVSKTSSSKFEILDSENVKIIIEDAGIWNYKIHYIAKI